MEVKQKMPEETRLQEDLAKTVKELADTYEELTLLYRFSEVISGLDVQDICKSVVEEAVSSAEADTAAVLLLEDKQSRLITRCSEGKWDRIKAIEWGETPVWRAIARRKPVCINDLRNEGLADLLPGHRSVILCPLIGKKGAIGILIVANLEGGEEFYSNDIKLMAAIAQQSALFIENTVLIREMEHFLIATIQSFVKVLEASSQWTAGHTERVTEYALAIASELGMAPDQKERLKICCLLHDIGKIATPKDILNKPSYLTDEEWKEIKLHPSTGAGILEGLEKFSDITNCIRYHHEHYDGVKSVHGLKGDDIPVNARILAVADAFDAMTSDRPYRKKKSTQDAVIEIQDHSGSQFDPGVVFAFTKWIDKMKEQKV
ncbi:MAG: HD domain-containing protein [Nitrospirota bacterium]|nr:MAG: HD domain-containing protein [Nitrospirota bacterium]